MALRARRVADCSDWGYLMVRREKENPFLDYLNANLVQKVLSPSFTLSDGKFLSRKEWLVYRKGGGDCLLSDMLRNNS